MKCHVLLGIFAFCVLVILATALIGIKGMVGASHAPLAPGPGVVPKGLKSAGLGLQAIPTSTNGQGITLAQVRQYVITNPFPGGPTISGQAPQIVSIQLVTSLQAEQLLNGEETGLPANAMVYLVILHGPFILTNVHSPAPIKMQPSPGGFEVFDAQTGNMLEWGTHA